MSEVCGDNRFKLIGEFKGKLVEGTNIETSPEEMAVLDNILFRIWQMGWLDKLKAQEPVRPRIGITHNDDGSKSYFLHCPLDGTTLDEGDKYCRKCGRAVKWE